MTTSLATLSNTHYLSHSFYASGVQAHLSWVLPKAAIKVSVRAGFVFGGSSGEGSAPTLTQVVDRIQFFVVLGLMSACFFTASKESKTLKQVSCQGRSHTQHKITTGEPFHHLCHVRPRSHGSDIPCCTASSPCSVDYKQVTGPTRTQGEGITPRRESEKRIILNSHFVLCPYIDGPFLLLLSK